MRPDVAFILLVFCLSRCITVGDRIVLKADIVRDFPSMCYDVGNCRPRPINSSWSIGACARASCESHDSGMLVEVRETCPRFQKSLMVECDLIENKRLEFPWCCPRMVCAEKASSENDFGGAATGDEVRYRKPIIRRKLVKKKVSKSLGSTVRPTPEQRIDKDLVEAQFNSTTHSLPTIIETVSVSATVEPTTDTAL